MMDAKEEVTTMCFTEGAFFLIAFRIPVVPLMAGSRRSFFVSVMLKWNYHSLISTHPTGIWAGDLQEKQYG